MDQAAIDEDVELLRQKIIELGTPQEDGNIGIAFAELYDKTQEIFEAINGTLRAAKKRKIVHFEGQMLLKGPSDKVVITLLPPVD